MAGKKRHSRIGTCMYIYEYICDDFSLLASPKCAHSTTFKIYEEKYDCHHSHMEASLDLDGPHAIVMNMIMRAHKCLLLPFLHIYVYSIRRIYVFRCHFIIIYYCYYCPVRILVFICVHANFTGATIQIDQQYLYGALSYTFYYYTYIWNMEYKTCIHNLNCMFTIRIGRNIV